jgi:hypothetical protein
MREFPIAIRAKKVGDFLVDVDSLMGQPVKGVVLPDFMVHPVFLPGINMEGHTD